MDFKIEYTWDGFPVKHEPVFVRLNPGDGGVVMEVSAPFFNDPPAPLGEPGKPFNELWDYEVVEAFFLNDITEQYLEVELCPHGQHLVLLLSGRRNVWKQELALSFRVSREETKWEGKAYLPWSYFPPKVTKFNSFAIHGSKDKRNYEALYPVPQHELQQGQKPDFWTIEFTAWENLPVLHRLVSLKFKSGIQGLLMEVNAFFDDLPTPPEYADQPRDGPWEYEGETFLFRVPKLREIESTCYIWGALLPYLLLLSEFTDTSCYLSEKLKIQWHGELGSKLCDLE